tara:strand:+ start:1491 stop:1916 length:426 start_codon:yes stop_codon:yes gene_type:complete
MKRLFKKISRIERRYIPKVRVSKVYLWIKLIVLSPLVLLDRVIVLVKSGGRIERKDKPDIVIANIIDGFSHLAFPDKGVEELATKRASICAQCPFAVKTSKYSVVVDNRTKDIQGMACSACGCNLSAKVRSVREYCPKGKW